MRQEELLSQIAELEREIAILPEGSLTKKKVKDKEYYYHRITQNGKRTENYLRFEEVPGLRVQIEKRKELEKELKKLKLLVVPEEEPERVEEEPLAFKTMVRIGKQLKSQIALTKRYRKRECIKELREYISCNQQDKVFIIYGLRRTGKTTMIRQILTELSDVEFKKAAFIQVRSKDTLADVDADLRLLEG